MVGYVQLTIEAQQSLDRSEVAYVVDAQKIVKDHIRDEYDVHVVDLTTEYTEKEDRRTTYELMARKVLDDAGTRDNPVALALYGHPMVFVSPSRMVAERARERGLDVEIKPGISAIDCVYADIEFDPARNGVHMFEATDLLLREWELNPDVPVMLWQIGAVETIRHTTGDSDPQRFERFKRYLRQFYPDDHTIQLLQTATYPIAESQRVEIPLAELETIASTIDAGAHILYIPPVRDRPIQNRELLDQVRSKEHIETITR